MHVMLGCVQFDHIVKHLPPTDAEKMTLAFVASDTDADAITVSSTLRPPVTQSAFATCLHYSVPLGAIICLVPCSTHGFLALDSLSFELTQDLLACCSRFIVYFSLNFLRFSLGTIAYYYETKGVAQLTGYFAVGCLRRHSWQIITLVAEKIKWIRRCVVRQHWL